jgi:DNA repair photolyase
MKPIYVPSGKAKEYGDYAINIYTGCPHRCYYCFAPSVLHRTKEEFHSHVEPRKGIVEAVKKQIDAEHITDKLIHLCFTCDPYPMGYDSTTTREIIKLLKDGGNHVQILTKNGECATDDFDLLDYEDWFGVTYAGYPNLAGDISPDEPGSDSPRNRLIVLRIAHRYGIKTWVSCEPVLSAEDVFYLIEKGNYIDRFKIGKLNYFPSDIRWAEFGRKAEALCKQYGRDYYIKEGLRKEMDGGKTDV